MKLQRIRIQNYRSIENLDICPSSLCALIGENNAGKSNILRALNLILGETWPSERAFSEEDFFNYDTSRDINIEVWTDTPYKFSRSGVDLECHGLKISVGHYKRAVKSKGKVAGDLKFDFVPLKKDGNPIHAPNQSTSKGKRGWMPIRVGNDIRDAFPFIYIDVRRDYSRHTAGSRWSVLSRLFAGVNEDFQRQDNTIESEGNSVSRRELFKQRMTAAFDLLRTDEFKKVEETIRTYSLKQVGLDPVSADVRIEFRQFDPINVYKNLNLVLCEGNNEFDADEIGAGYQSSIVVAIFRAYQELNRQGAIIAIEEPEVFLHPHRQRFFHRVLAELAEQGNQVFYTTHSAQFVDVTVPEHIYIVRRRTPEGTTVASCTTQQWDPDKKELFKLEKEFDPERNEMFFAKGVILCEGDTEKSLFPAVLNAKNIDPDEAGISIVEVGGKDNLPFFIKVLESFRIPYVVLYDEDDATDAANVKRNTDITRCSTDAKRLFMFKPNLEKELGYRPQGNKIAAALAFFRKGLSNIQEDRLIAPIAQLLSEVNPAFSRTLQKSDTPSSTTEK